MPLTILMASDCSMDWMCMLIMMSLSISRKSASMRSDNSGAMICKYDAAPSLSPILKSRALRKRNDVGAMKSLVLMPDFSTMS